MRRYAVIGRPARHSLSPWLHARFAQKTQRDIVYAAIETDDFAAAAAAFFAAGGSGLNITVPYKAEALAFASSATAFARQCGSANVLLKQPGGALRACNTDGAGLIGDLQFYCTRLGISLSEQTILLLGAGGAARAAAFALAKTRSKRRPKPLHIYNRTPARARAGRRHQQRRPNKQRKQRKKYRRRRGHRASRKHFRVQGRHHHPRHLRRARRGA